MVLISVDLPHPLGPRIQRCSPAPICNVTSARAGRCSRAPRRTVTCSRESSGAGGVMSGIKPGVILAQDDTLLGPGAGDYLERPGGVSMLFIIKQLIRFPKHSQK